MRRKSTLFVAIAAVIIAIAYIASRAAAPVARSDAGDPDPLVLGFLPSQRAEEILPNARALGDFLSERMGRQVEVLVPTAYEPLVEGLRFGHVHAAFLDGGPAWIAHKRTGARVILAEVNSGETFYWAEAFVRSDAPIRTIEEVIGKRVAFTSRTGSSGFLMPIGWLIAHGHIHVNGGELTHLESALQSSFASTTDAGGYQQALKALVDGRVDVAFGAHDAPVRFLTEAERSRIRPLYRFGRIPSHAVLVSGRLNDDAVNRLKAAMLALNDPANLPLLRAVYGVDGLVETDTQSHLGDFGAALEALPGMDRTLLAKSNR